MHTLYNMSSIMEILNGQWGITKSFCCGLYAELKKSLINSYVLVKKDISFVSIWFFFFRRHSFSMFFNGGHVTIYNNNIHLFLLTNIIRSLQIHLEYTKA